MNNSKKIMGSVALATILALGVTGCGGGGDDAPAQQAQTPGGQNNPSTNGITAQKKDELRTTYADIALANYSDALADAKLMQTALRSFTTTPTEDNFTAAKNAWLKARESYGPTEIFRLSNGPIDSEDAGFMQTWGAPEGQLNAWPLDENMIDYTRDASGATTSGNIIDTAAAFTPAGGTSVDVTTITKDKLAELNENGGEANVATGYHAIEFLLWGQDQDYADFLADNVTLGAMVAGERVFTDFTTATNADRRKDYLNAAADLLVDDLQAMVDAWSAGAGSYREAFLGNGSNAIATDTALKQIFIGMGMFIKSELANERMAVAILTPSEEDEHSCFSDNTHRDIVLNYEGFKNILNGTYTGATAVNGTSLYSLLSASTKAKIDAKLTKIDASMTTMDTQAKTVEHFDYQIKDGSANKTNLSSAKNELRDLGNLMVDVAGEFGVSIDQNDVTDPEETDI